MRDTRDPRAPFGDKERSPRATNRAAASDRPDGAGGSDSRNRASADERRPRMERGERTDRPFRSAERPPRDAATPFAGARKTARPVKDAAASPSASAARRAPTGAGRPSRGAPAGDANRRPASDARGRAGIGKRSDAAKPSKPIAPRVASPVKAAPAGNPTERPQHTDGLVRVSKRMSELGLCSRREADEWIENGWVRVDGERIDTLGTRIRPDQQIEVTRDAHVAQSRQVTILLNKPVGYVSGQAEDGYEPAVTLITAANRWEGDRASTRFLPSHLRALAPAGRLDIDSTGLLVLTQDGRIAKQLIGEHSGVEKEYLVRVTYGDRTTDIDGHFPADQLALLRFGLSLDDTPLKPAKVSWQNGEQMRFVLREGKKRQIRRMCELVGLHVVGLKRVRMGRVPLGALPLGQWRYLLPDEAF
jgi:23S rRNA pseudouridine2604 synthase